MTDIEQKRKIRVWAHAGDAGNPIRHEEFVWVTAPADATDDDTHFDKDAEDFMWEHVEPSFGWEFADDTPDEDMTDDWS